MDASLIYGPNPNSPSRGIMKKLNSAQSTILVHDPASQMKCSHVPNKVMLEREGQKKIKVKNKKVREKLKVFRPQIKRKWI